MTKSIRKSATAIAPKTVTPAVEKPAGRSTVPQSIVDAFMQADAKVGDAVVNVFRACVTGKVTPDQFGTRSDAKVRASEFNVAGRCADALGADHAMAIIDQLAASDVGTRRVKIVDALRAAIKAGEEISTAGKKPGAAERDRAAVVGKVVKAATTKATVAAVARKAATSKAPATPAPNQAPRQFAAWGPVALAAMAALRDSAAAVVDKPDTRGWADMLDALSEAVECLDGMVHAE